jgi:mannose-6-phosphate isomerase-like protein (cupin superfamily)
MDIVGTDRVLPVPAGTTPDYSFNNPELKLLGLLEKTRLAAGREAYLMQHTQYLFPIDYLELYGPSGGDAVILDPRQQDNKIDFQKQNVHDFYTADTQVARGLVAVGEGDAAWVGPFLRLSYRGGVDSRLSVATNHGLGGRIGLWVRVGSVATSQPLVVPYNEETDRYEIELWGYPGTDLASRLSGGARAAFDRGELVARPDLVRGSAADFDREKLDGQFLFQVAADNTMHPVRPLHLEVAWSDEKGQVWDSQGGRNYQYEFNMLLRGWDHFLGVGVSPNPHGGVGFLEYRNLISNYFQYGGLRELGRDLEAWNFDAFGSKSHAGTREPFFSVDYMDVHLLRANCGIGLHRHRDNQEVFLMLDGQGFMVVGDWCKMPQRDRCLEVRTLRAGHMAMLKGGNLHGLMNPSDEDMFLFMFGGYD